MKRNVRILLVEDNILEIRLFEIQLLKFQEMMKSEKGTVPMVSLDIVQDGQDAKDYLLQEGEFAHKDLPDLVLLDYYMPKVTGLELLLDLEQTELFQFGYPLIMMMTAYKMSPGEILDLYRLGLSAILEKPKTMQEFSTMMNFWLHCIVYAM
jgi:chemotaxis family two-component system response regulator Rcp1